MSICSCENFPYTNEIANKSDVKRMVNNVIPGICSIPTITEAEKNHLLLKPNTKLSDSSLNLYSEAFAHYFNSDTDFVNGTNYRTVAEEMIDEYTPNLPKKERDEAIEKFLTSQRIRNINKLADSLKDENGQYSFE